MFPRPSFAVRRSGWRATAIVAGSRNPTPDTPGPADFALSGSEGDDVWLTVPNGAGGISRFADDVHFGAAFNGQTMGITAASDGRLTPLTRNGSSGKSMVLRQNGLYNWLRSSFFTHKDD